MGGAEWWWEKWARCYVMTFEACLPLRHGFAAPPPPCGGGMIGASWHQDGVDRLRQRFGIVERVVEAAAFVAVEGGADDQVGGLEQVA